MSIDVIMLLLFGPVIIGLLYAGYRINREEQALAEGSASEPDAAVPVASVTAPSPVGVPRAVGPRPRAVYEIERRLRHELALAQAFSDDPSPETLWLS